MRWIGGGLLVALVPGCGSRVPIGEGSGDGTADTTTIDSAEVGNPTSDPTVDPTGGEPGTGISIPTNRDVDILFVIDNSGTMGIAQGRLAAALESMLAVLDAPGSAVNYRIGVTTTDNGNPWCGSTSPEAGNLVASSCRGRTGEFVFNGNPPADATAVACTDVCNLDDVAIVPTTTELDPTPRPRPWLESTAGVTNVDGASMLDALRCTMPQGIAGCGFESPLESMYKSLLRVQSEEEDEFGFIRSAAVLAVVIVSDEVDCSYANEYQSIFLPADQGGDPSVFWSDPDASAPTSAVCWNAGTVCDGGPGTYDGCRASNKDVSGQQDVGDDDAVLLPVSRYVELLQQLEDNKGQISPGQQVLVTHIGGVPPGYESGAAEIVYADALDPLEQQSFGIGAGCVIEDGDPGQPGIGARPPVRERELAEAFEVDGRNLYSICADDYGGTLEAVALGILDQMPASCFPACAADTDPVAAGVDPLCALVQESVDLDSGAIVEVDVPLCEGTTVPDDADVCYTPLVGDQLSPRCAEVGWNLEFQILRRPGVPAPPGANIRATCQLSANEPIDCPLLP